MKKFLSVILSILMVVTMLPMAVLPASAATPTPYDGVPVTPQKISSGNYAKLGLTSSNWSQFNGYYAIRNAKELYGFAAVSRNSYTANAVLLQDIVVNANGGTTYDWTPIISPNAGYIYESIFDGNGHYISGLYSTVAIAASGGNNAKFGGFICRLGGTAKNLVIKNSTFAPCEDISTFGGVGAITGYPVSCTIQNCRVENITLKSINDGGQLGGIAGYGNGNNSTIKNCVSINVTFSGGVYTNSIAPKAPYSSCYTSATASHNCTKLSVEHKEVKATCEYPGLSNYKYCLVCGKVTSGTKTETPATGHTLKSATCIAPKTCTVCGATEGSVDNTAHSWANNDGICANGCGATCAHKNQTGSACEICGAELHVCSNYNNGFCTGCDAYEPAELKDGYYQIKNGGNLFWYANYINTVDRTANAVLVSDIDLENRPWTPIGSTGENSNNFRGIFDGQNYTIKGLYAEGGRAGLGFFGEVRTGTVKNFTIYGEVVANTEVDYVGGVIGSVCGVNGENDLERNGAIIQNITSYVNLTAKAHGVGKIGGFVGYANHQSLIENCSWYGTFDAGKYRVDNGAGGFIGRIQENTSEVTIRNCGAYGTIKTNYAGDYNNTATIYMGGFLSFSNTSAKTTLENCLFAGKFECGENLTDEAFLGAFGTLRSVNAIKNCYYLGDDGLEAVHSDSSLKPGSDNVEITKVTEEQLKSGEIAYKLQEANEIWGQSIGTDAYPVLGGEDVYCGYTACDDEAMVYTNDSTVSATKPDHAWDEGSLTRPTKTADGYYAYTCSACGETKTEPVLRAANYDDYTKALEDLRAYLDSDMLTDENKSYISEWLATYDTDEAYSYIAGEEATVQEYIDATAYYASEIEAAIEDCLAGNHSGNGETCEICGATLHTCDFSGEWKYDADKHWKECTVDGCDKISKEADHSFADGKCYVCDYECPHESYTDGVCDNCEYACPHENVTGATCITSVECDVCGYSVFDWTNHEGEYVTVWFNDYQHVSEYECCHIESSVVYEDHDYKDYTVTTPADCVNNAWETGTCICGDTHTREIAGSAKNHDWSDKNGICTNCGEVCPHEKYTMGICDECNYLCPHSFTVFNETVAPKCEETGWEESYCDYCSIKLEQEIPALDHDWVSGGIERPSQNTDGSWSDGYYYDSCKNDEEHIRITGVAKRVDYSAYDEAYKALKDEQKNEKLTDEGAVAVNQAVMSGMSMPQNIVEGESTTAYLNNWVKNAQSILAKIANGEYVKINGLEEIVKINDELNEELTEKYGEEALAEITDKIGDKYDEKFDELYEKAEALTGSVAENKEALEEIKAEMEAIFAEIEKCLAGVHNGFVYEVTEEAKCGVNAIESATCTLCGETDEREVEGSALEHSFTKYEVTEEAKCGVAGKEVAYCDNGCQTTDEREIPALEHIFVDYKSNGDATCTADGTKTAFCIHGCGATDTVADEGSMVDHADEDGDKICDDCQAEIADVCPDCGRPVHEDSGISRYICILIMLIRLVISFFKAI